MSKNLVGKKFFLNTAIIILILILVFSIYKIVSHIISADTTPFVPVSSGQDIEETTGWSQLCYTYSDARPRISCDGVFNENTQDKISGNFSIKVNSTKDKDVRYILNKFPVEKNQTYKVSFKLKIENRQTFNYIDLDYPASLKTSYTLNQTKGYWRGRYFFKVNGTDFVPTIPTNSPYVASPNVDWFTEDGYVETGDKSELQFMLMLQGYDGSMNLDNLTLEKVDSIISDDYLKQPTVSNFSGMKITKVSDEQKIIETNAASFNFSNNTFYQNKDNQEIAQIVFPADFLSGLKLTQSKGYALAENENIIFSIGKDSVATVKLKKEVQLKLKSSYFKDKKYYNFEGGILFASDYERGILFAPLRSKYAIGQIKAQGVYDANTINWDYPDDIFENIGIKNWQTTDAFGSSNWEINYSFDEGSGFISEVFPPKDFNNEKYCNDQMYSADVSINDLGDKDYSYFFENFKQKGNIVRLILSQYAVSPGNEDKDFYYYMDENKNYVSPDTAGAKKYKLAYAADVSGPYSVAQKQGLSNFVKMAHNRGLKVIIYMTPQYYYTSDTDNLLQELKRTLDDFDLDGVYFDGVYPYEDLKSLSFSRSVRDILGDKYYYLHDSWTNNFLSSDKFRFPAIDAYADTVLTGENVKKADDNTWQLNYAGENVSNTPSDIIAELRPVDYSLPKDDSANLSLSPEQQIDKSLQYNARFRTSVYDPISFITDKKNGVKINYDSQIYWKKLEDKCTTTTCGNNKCDVLESFLTCPKDCAPKSTQTDLVYKNGIFSLSKNSAVAQWILDSKPFYNFHYTFDQTTAIDISGNKLNPDSFANLNYKASELKEIDQRTTHYFDGASKLNGKMNSLFDINNQDFSSFAIIKTNGTQSGPIFSLGGADGFYYSVEEGKFVLFYKDANVAAETKKISSQTAVNDNKWHSVGFVYSQNNLTIYIDGIKEGEAQAQLPSFDNGETFAIGANQNNNYFLGYIDDLFIVPLALDKQQIEQYPRNNFEELATSAKSAKAILEIADGNFASAQLPGSNASQTVENNTPQPSLLATGYSKIKSYLIVLGIILFALALYLLYRAKKDNPGF